MPWLRTFLRSILNTIRSPSTALSENNKKMAAESQDIIGELMATPPRRVVQHLDDDSQDVSESHDVTFLQDYVILDVETTGLDVDKCRVIQLAMIKVSPSGAVDTFSKYFNPCLPREVQLKAYGTHKISPDILLRKKTFKYHYDDVVDFLTGVKYLVGHNVLFDWNFLEKEIRIASQGNPSELLDLENVVLIDTYKSSISSFPDLRSFSLSSVAGHLKLSASRQPVMNYRLTSPSKNKKELITVTEDSEDSLHDALTDTMITKEVFSACVEILAALGANERQEFSLDILAVCSV